MQSSDFFRVIWAMSNITQKKPEKQSTSLGGTVKASSLTFTFLFSEMRMETPGWLHSYY